LIFQAWKPSRPRLGHIRTSLHGEGQSSRDWTPPRTTFQLRLNWAPTILCRIPMLVAATAQPYLPRGHVQCPSSAVKLRTSRCVSVCMCVCVCVCLCLCVRVCVCGRVSCLLLLSLHPYQYLSLSRPQQVSERSPGCYFVIQVTAPEFCCKFCTPNLSLSLFVCDHSDLFGLHTTCAHTVNEWSPLLAPCVTGDITLGSCISFECINYPTSPYSCGAYLLTTYYKLYYSLTTPNIATNTNALLNPNTPTPTPPTSTTTVTTTTTN
jgi:hypothetical protein